MTFGPKYPNFGVKIADSLVAHWSLAGHCFQHERGFLLVPRYEGAKSFASSPNKLNIWPKNRIFDHFGPYIGFSGPFGAMPDQKNNANEMLGGFLIY